VVSVVSGAAVVDDDPSSPGNDEVGVNADVVVVKLPTVLDGPESPSVEHAARASVSTMMVESARRTVERVEVPWFI
jgi:hypothetical protein